MKRVMMVLALLAAQLNLTALVPAAHGQGAPPLWVGGGFLWPFFRDTPMLLPFGALRDSYSPLLGIAAAGCFLLAAVAVHGRIITPRLMPVLVVAGVVFSVPLQFMWLSGWAVLPLLVDATLIWLLFVRTSPAVAVRAAQ